jgi:hypothetical protein
MLVIVSLRRLDNDRIEIGVARPQHDSNPTHNYASEKEVRAVLSDFGISEESIASHLKLLAQMGAGEELKIPPIYVPQNDTTPAMFKRYADLFTDEEKQARQREVQQRRREWRESQSDKLRVMPTASRQ